MLKKKREKSKTLQTYEALLRRIDKNCQEVEMIQKDYQKFLAGFKGEKQIDYPLSFLDEKTYYIFHDLRLFDGKNYFQMDTFILSTHMIIIAEIKNYSGTLIFDPVFKQVIRILDEKEEALPNPVIQVKRQIAQFKQWLAMNKLPDLPIEPLVLIANGRAVLKMNQSNYEIPKIVSTLYDFPNKIKNLEKQHPEPVITKADVNKIMRRLLKQHQPNTQDLFSIYGISKNKVKKGVMCEACQQFSMDRIHGKWKCRKCGHTSVNSHIEALHDYALLFGPEISIRAAMDFLQVTSRHVVRRLLNAMGLASELRKGKLIYYLEFENR